MIRRSVSKAFGPSGVEHASVETARSADESLSHAARVNALFGELHAAFERAAAERIAAGPAGSSGEERVTKVRPRPEGLEFEVGGALGTWRFLNSMDGTVWIVREEAGRAVREAVVTVQRDGPHLRAVLKQGLGARRPFVYTTVPALVRAYFGVLAL